MYQIMPVVINLLLLIYIKKHYYVMSMLLDLLVKIATFRDDFPNAQDHYPDYWTQKKAEVVICLKKFKTLY